MELFFNKLFCCHSDAKEIIENKPSPFVVSKKEETITSFLVPLEESISSFFIAEETKETKEKESITDLLEPIEKTITALFAPEETKEPEKENHSICSFIHLHSREEEKPKPIPHVDKINPFSWTDSIFIYLHPNLLLDKYLSDYVQWKTQIWKEKIGYPYSLYVVCSVFIVGTTSCLYYYFNK